MALSSKAARPRIKLQLHGTIKWDGKTSAEEIQPRLRKVCRDGAGVM